MKSFVLSAIFVLASVGLAYGQDATTEAFIEKCEVAALQRIASLRTSVRDMETQQRAIATDTELLEKGKKKVKIATGRIVYPVGAMKRNLVAENKRESEALAVQIKQANTEIADLESGKNMYIPTMATNVKVGDVGLFKTSAKIRQVIDQDNLLVERLAFNTDEISESAARRVSASSPEAEKLLKPMLIWVKGRSTSGLIDGADVDLREEAFAVTSTKTYKTALGSNTVFVFEPFDVERAKKAYRERRGK